MIIGHQVEKPSHTNLVGIQLIQYLFKGHIFCKERNNDPKDFLKHTKSSQIRVKISCFRSRMTIKVIKVIKVFNMYAIAQSVLKIPIGLKVC